MPAAFSPESRIEAGLRSLACSGRSFVDIAKGLNVRISHGPFSEGLKKGFDVTMAESLLDILERMRDLQQAVADAPVDWSRTDRVTTALTIRRVAQFAAEFNDHRLDGVAEAAVRGDHSAD